ncbi:cytochrome P450 [Micromonospora rifamycinica]|uniref:Cytochrome P450 n=1 Tax=Micromonospora rifamycinica TaxID=291594 RepID=A0A120F9C1_9ACTN|nr:cytochrome P450 [Micromonospora rifamycinica]KWV33155.1 cytochrome [Micromonospora rifamycinica]SCG51263.1 Cytochrome P450 [Micromonospora rifamycinica]
MGFSVSLDELLGDEVRRDPYPYYARLHELGEAAALPPTAPYAAVVHGYDAAHRVLRDPVFRVLDADHLDRSGLRWRDHPVIRTLQASMFNAPPDEHARLRQLFGQALTARRVAALEPAILRIADGLLDGLAEAGADGRPVDFMAAFALPLPSAVVGELLGVPQRDRDWFPSRVRAFDAVLEIGPRSFREIRAANAAAEELTGYFAALVAARRAEPRDDLVSALVRIRDEQPDQLTEAELSANLIVMYNAGFRTTANLFGNGLALLTARPAALAALRADPSLAPAYVEEILRYEPPVHFAVRYAAEDTEIAGVTVAKGRSVLVLTGAANRDPRRFTAPDSFDPSRRDNRHLAFSGGPHYCLGAALGRAEGRLVLPRLLDRFPGLTLAEAPGERRELMLRGHDRLPVHVVAPHTDRSVRTVRVDLAEPS